VSPEVASIGERAIAVLTSERLLTSVRSDVTLKQPRPGERLATRVTLAGQRVRSDVHFQRAQTDIYLLAEFAREGLLCLTLSGCAVKLLMLRQAGKCRVRFVAVCAWVPGRRRARGSARAGAWAALFYFRIHDRGSGGSATGGRPAAFTAGRGQIFRRHGRRRSQRARTHGTRR